MPARRKISFSISFALSCGIHCCGLLFLSVPFPSMVAPAAAPMSTPAVLVEFRLGRIDAPGGLPETAVQNEETALLDRKNVPDEKRSEPVQETPREAALHISPPAALSSKEQTEAPSALSPGDSGSSGCTRLPDGIPDAYILAVRKKIQGSCFYPGRARQKGMEGQVTVAFHVTALGMIRDMDILSPSEHALLNRAALQIVQKASPLPSPPNGFSGAIEVPLRFVIRD